MYWLLEQNALQSLELAHSCGLTVTAEQQAEFSARISSAEDGPRILKTAGGSAEMTIEGVLTDSPDIFAMIFGGGNTTYPEIVAALAAAEANPEVERLRVTMKTPGGSMDGLFDAIAAMQAFSKPIDVVASLAASAGYALAAQGDTIAAKDLSSRFGSVGVVGTFSKPGDNKVVITSTQAPNKRPDLDTKKGRDVALQEIDALHDIFVDAIGEGRGVTPKTVNADFGKGSTFLAGEALKRGMIDAVGVRDSSTPKAGVAGTTKLEATTMDLQTLKGQHGALYATVVAEGVALGTQQEHDRVCAHLKMGVASGDIETAHTAIEEKTEMTATLTATYMAAGMRRKDKDDREGDDVDAAAADGAAGNPPAPESADAQASAAILAAAAEHCGVELGEAS